MKNDGNKKIKAHSVLLFWYLYRTMKKFNQDNNDNLKQSNNKNYIHEDIKDVADLMNAC
jgi:hypothetical protein